MWVDDRRTTLEWATSKQQPRVQGWEAGTGSGRGLTGADAAAMGAGLAEWAWEAYRVFHCGDWRRAYRLENQLWIWTCDKAKKGRWPLPKGKKEVLRRLVLVAMMEDALWQIPLARVREICPWARGMELLEDEEGSRKGGFPEAVKAEFIQIPRSTWYRAWRPRYAEVRTLIGDLLAEVDRHYGRADRRA